MAREADLVIGIGTPAMPPIGAPSAPGARLMVNTAPFVPGAELLVDARRLGLAVPHHRDAAGRARPVGVVFGVSPIGLVLLR